MASWYIAVCDQCGEDFSTPDEPTRERWAREHYESTEEHVVRYWTATDQLIPGLSDVDLWSVMANLRVEPGRGA